MADESSLCLCLGGAINWTALSAVAGILTAFAATFGSLLSFKMARDSRRDFTAAKERTHLVRMRAIGEQVLTAYRAAWLAEQFLLERNSPQECEWVLKLIEEIPSSIDPASLEDLVDVPQETILDLLAFRRNLDDLKASRVRTGLLDGRPLHERVISNAREFRKIISPLVEFFDPGAIHHKKLEPTEWLDQRKRFSEALKGLGEGNT